MRKSHRAALGTSLWAVAFALASPTLASQDQQSSVPTGQAGGEAATSSSTDAKGLPAPTLPNGNSATATTAIDSADIVVTAQRREQRLQEAPVAVTALSGASLDQLNIRNTQDLMQVVPGLQIATQTAGNGGGSATFFLRGMGQERSGNGSEPAVGVYVDDFYYPSLSGTLFKVVDLAQIEVLRGPQGTLFGRNTIGGAIRYTTQDAKLGTFSGHVTGTVGNYDHYDITGAVNIPISDFAAVRVSGGHLQEEGYVRVQSGGRDAGRTRTDLLRVQARIEPTSNLYIDVTNQYSKDKLDGFTYNLPGPLTPLPPAPGTQPGLPFIYNVAIAPRLGLPLYTDALRSQCFYCEPGTNQREFSNTTYKNALATVGWDIGHGLSLKSLTGWQDVYTVFNADLDGTLASIYGGGIIPSETYAFSQELQLNGKLFDDRLNFVTGAYYYNERRPYRLLLSPQIILGQPTLNPVESRFTKSYASFVDASLKLTEKLSLLGGFRYSDDDKRVVSVSQATTVVVGTAAGKFDSSTFRAGAQYQWSRDIMTYFDVSTGFRAGGFNPYSTTPGLSLVPFQPEKSTSYEIGLRTQFLDRRITLNPTAFYVDWSNIQIQSVIIIDASTGAAGPVLSNVGKARSYGLELEGAFQATDHVRLFGNLAYLDIRYTQIGAATGLTLDSELQRAPPVTFSLGGAHTLDLRGGSKIVSTVNFAFEDRQQSSPKTSLVLPSYGLLGARVEFTNGGGQFSLSAFVTNLLDKHYYVGGVDYTNIVGSPHYDVGRPREFGGTARFNF